MNLKDALNFVRGAIGVNTIVPELEHYILEPGRITGSNGHLTLSAPIDLDISAMPKAALFSRALLQVETAEAVSLYMTEGNRLAVRGDNFSAFIPCLEEPFDVVEPDGDKHSIPDTFVSDLGRMLPFTSEDASRLWSQGVLCEQGTLFATNNIVLVQLWNGHDLPRINLPKFMVAELQRIKQTPECIQTNERSVSFLFPDGAWMSSALLTDSWPFETMEGILSRESSPQPIPPDLDQALKDLIPFTTDGKSSPVFFKDGKITTSPHAEDGAEFKVDGVVAGPIFNAHQLRLVLTEASALDFSSYPAPCGFIGDRLRGVIVGRAA